MLIEQLCRKDQYFKCLLIFIAYKKCKNGYKYKKYSLLTGLIGV